MNAQKSIFAGVVSVVFLFAGYNLYSYFSNQSDLQVQKDLVTQDRLKERDRIKAKKAEAQLQEQAERKREQQKEERLAAERQAADDAKRLVEKQKREAKQQKRLAEAERNKETRLLARIQKARTPRHIEGIAEDTIAKFNSVSARYIRDHPTEFLKPRFDQNSFGSRTSFERLTQRDTNTLMLYAAISQDTDILRVLLDIGLDVNSANKAGYTPLMFASAYNTPEIVKFLISEGGDISAKTYVQDLNALHIASLLNPKPDVIDVLLGAGIDIEAKTENEYTPLVLAASDNRNLEVVERLAVRGANKGAYDAKGLTALKIVEARVRGEGDEYIRISDIKDGEVYNLLVGK